MSSLNWNLLWVWVVNPVLTKVWDLGVKRLLEQGPVVSESGNSGTGGTTPKNQILTVSLGSGEVERDLSNLVCWTSNVLAC